MSYLDIVMKIYNPPIEWEAPLVKMYRGWNKYNIKKYQSNIRVSLRGKPDRSETMLLSAYIPREIMEKANLSKFVEMIVYHKQIDIIPADFLDQKKKVVRSRSIIKVSARQSANAVNVTMVRKGITTRLGEPDFFKAKEVKHEFLESGGVRVYL